MPLRVVLLGVLAMTLASASLQPSTLRMQGARQKPPRVVRIAATGFAVERPLRGLTPPDAPRRSVAALIVENSNPDWAAESVRFVVIMHDDTGMVLAEADVIVDQLLPAERRSVVVPFLLAPDDAGRVAVAEA